MNKKWSSLTWVASLVALMVPVTGSFAQHGEHGQHEQEEAEVAKPTSYADAVSVIGAQLEKIEELIATRQLHRVHAEAAVIRDIAGTLARLALDKGSGVPRSAVKEINLTARDLAAKFGPIDEAGDSGNRAGTQKIYDEMIALFEILERYAPQQYVCPMRCEPGKIYSTPGRCPVCSMYLEKMADQYSVDVTPVVETIKPGASTMLFHTIRHPSGAVVNNLDVVHEKILHLLIVSEDLSWYVHEHPQVQPDGAFRERITFPRAGEYVLFHDFTPSGADRQVVPVTLRVEGISPPRTRLVVDSASAKRVDGYTIRLDTNGPISTDRDTTLTYQIRRDGEPVTDLEPYLGAMGHLVVVSQDLKQFVHSHPLGAEHGGTGPHDDKEHGSRGHDEHSEHGGVAVGSISSAVTFHARFPVSGLYKSWAQFKHQGHVFTVPFVIDVSSAEDGGHHDHH